MVRKMDIQLFIDMLNVDSTTGKEGEFADYLVHRLAVPDAGLSDSLWNRCPATKDTDSRRTCF